MGELRAEASTDRHTTLRPADRRADLGAAKVRRHLLGVAEGRVEDLRPSRSHVRECFRSTPGIQVGQQFFHRRLHAVEIGEFVRGAIAAAFRTGAVVARHEDHQRVVQFTRRTNGFDDSADLVIGVFQKACVDFRLPGVKALLVRSQAVPGRNRIRTGGQFCALRNETEGDLARQTSSRASRPSLRRTRLSSVASIPQAVDAEPARRPARNKGRRADRASWPAGS